MYVPTTKRLCNLHRAKDTLKVVLLLGHDDLGFSGICICIIVYFLYLTYIVVIKPL